MNNQLVIALAQTNLLVGDIEGNTDKVIEFACRARDEMNADVILFPELTLTGYPPEDLILRAGLHERVDKALDRLREAVSHIYMVVGHPLRVGDDIYNSASVIHDGEIIANYRKQCLPNYAVFDEKRYFTAGSHPCIVDIKGVPIAVTICEDMWYPGSMQQAVDHGAQLVVSLNASPYRAQKSIIREQMMAERAREGNIPLVYVNLVGGQDELVFDGGSMVLNSQGEVMQHADFFTEALILVQIDIKKPLLIKAGKPLPTLCEEEMTYRALVTGIKDYIEKNDFKGVVIGLSGGIDSALTLALAVDAIGSDRVETVMMPSRYTSSSSLEDAKTQAKTMQVKYSIISIETIFKAFLDTLKQEFAGLPQDTTEENLQARVRGTLLMAISNKKNLMVLSTGNKSELSVGYATLYGDMVGGFCALKDVPKTMVYKLSEYRNKISPIIPERVITRPPSAELAEGQLDQDSLPPYPILDAILERYIENDESINCIVKAGYDAEIVRKIAKMVDRNEYKRRQAPPGVRITKRAFGRDRRYPITSGFGRNW